MAEYGRAMFKKHARVDELVSYLGYFMRCAAKVIYR